MLRNRLREIAMLVCFLPLSVLSLLIPAGLARSRRVPILSSSQKEFSAVARDGAIFLVILATVLIASSTRAATVLLNDGQPHEIRGETNVNDEILVRNAGCGSVSSPRAACASPGDPTQLELLDNARVNYIESFDSSTITLRSGEVKWSAWAYGSGKIDIESGHVSYGFFAYDDASVTMSDGTVLGTSDLYDAASLTMTGGYVYNVYTRDDSTFSLSGGNPNGVTAKENSRVEILGKDFMLDGVAVPYGPIVASDGLLTGTLESDEALYISISRDPGASITLVPEPAQTLLYACALLTLALLRRRASSCSGVLSKLAATSGADTVSCSAPAMSPRTSWMASGRSGHSNSPRQRKLSMAVQFASVRQTNFRKGQGLTTCEVFESSDQPKHESPA
jgi:hypothetical protein